MNKNDFIDNALKEHARLEGHDDQDFLDELESKLDTANVVKIQEKNPQKKSRNKALYWSAAAATVIVSGYALVLMNQEDDPELISYHVSSRQETEINVDPVASRERGYNAKGDKGASMSKDYLAPPAEAPPVDGAGRDSQLVRKPVTKPTAPDGRPAQISTKPVTRPTTPVKGDGRLLADLSNERFSNNKGNEFGDVPLETDASLRGVSVPTIRRAKVLSSPLNGRGRSDFYFEDRRGGRAFGIEPAPSGNRYGALVEQGFLSPLSAALSTFSIDVDTAAYTNLRRHIVTGQSVHPDAVRIEEMINYFDYQYAQPEGEHPFAVHTEVASCPWNPKHRLVKIGLQGKAIDEGERKAANLVFLLDVSGSMSSSDKLPLLVQSFQILLKELNEEDRVSLVVYAGRQAVLLDPTAIDEDGRTQVAQALRQLKSGGSTAGAAGITTAYDLARKGFIEGGVNRVILATDGDFNVGVTNTDKLVELVKNQAEGNISLSVLGFGQGNLNDEMMEKLTNSGNGNYFYIDSLREGQKVFQQGLTGTIQTIAKDVKIQVEFNPGKVGQYRLIGYANRRLKDEDFKNDKVDAGDIGAGHRVTALYEIVPAGVLVANDLKYQKVKEEPKREIVDSPEMLTVKLRYKQPDGDVSTELAKPMTDGNRSWEEASEDFRFSSGVALWGMILRNSKYAGNGTPELVSQLALSGQGDDVKGERTEMIDLVRRWSSRR